MPVRPLFDLFGSGQGAPAVADVGSAVGVDQAQGAQGGLCGLVWQLAAHEMLNKYCFSFTNVEHLPAADTVAAGHLAVAADSEGFAVAVDSEGLVDSVGQAVAESEELAETADSEG